ncbi:MAG TPA: hypothetical protein O0W88_05000 [Methanocorpusculum sp.]|nr:hypothetical protein [Methanocorpusculum sp.]
MMSSSAVAELHTPSKIIDCKNTGTSMRLLTGVFAHIAGTISFTGDASLCSRSMKLLLDTLGGLGAGITCNQ